MSIKKRFTAILSFLLAFCILLGVCGAFAAVAGETVEVEFTVLEDTEAIFMAKLELQYDHEALELIPNRSFEGDIKWYTFGMPLQPTFRIRENAAPGDYPVTLKILEASGPVGETVLSPEAALLFSEEHVIVERPPVEVPVYYADAATGELVKTETISLTAGQISMLEAGAPEGWEIIGGHSMSVNVSEDGQAVPQSVTFWLAATAPTPEAPPIPTPTSYVTMLPAAAPMAEPSPSPTKSIWVESDGVLVSVTQTLFVERSLGISFWYESDYLMAYDTQAEGEAYDAVIVTPSDPANDHPIFLEIMSLASVEKTAEEFLAEVPASFSLDAYGEVEEVVMDSGEHYRYCAGTRGDVYYEFYTVTGGRVDVCVIMSCPTDALDTYGARLDRLIWSLAFTSAE